MTRVIGARLLQAMATAWLLATLCFAFVHALPGDLALRVAAARLGVERLTPQAIERVRDEAGLDQPLVRQYAHWVAALTRGDLGRSLVSGRPVVDELGRAARLTVILGIAGWLLAYALALPLGLLAGLRPGGAVDTATNVVAAGLAAMPPFLIGVVLVGVFALGLRWLPPAGASGLAHLVLPAATLALGLAAYAIRIVRNAVAEVRRAFYMTFATMRGWSPRAALRRHGARNAAIPVATYAALQLALVFDGVVVIETLFAYPGLGNLLVTSLLASDVPLVMAIALLLALSYAGLSLVADLVCLGLDPRRRAAQL